MSVRAAYIALVAAGCSARLGAASQIGGDAGSDSTSIDAATVTPLDAGALDAANACASGRVVYLSFEGQTLTHAGTSDATANKASWLGVGSGTLAKFRPNAADRTTQIQAVVAGLTATVHTIAPTITFVTTRPAAGPYVMVGFGGSKDDVGVPYTDAVSHLDCGDSNKSDVAWIFEAESSTIAVVNGAAGALAFGLGATGTTDPDDCMCGWLTDCVSSTIPCTFSATANSEQDCPNEDNPQDDITLLQSFCD